MSEVDIRLNLVRRVVYKFVQHFQIGYFWFGRYFHVIWIYINSYHHRPCSLNLILTTLIFIMQPKIDFK